MTTDSPRATRGRELINELGHSWISGAGLYMRLAPHGAELTHSDHAAVRQQLISSASTLRALGAEQSALETFLDQQSPRIDVRRTLTLLRVINRNLVLAISDDPRRRSNAIPASDLASLARPVYDYWMSL